MAVKAIRKTAIAGLALMTLVLQTDPGAVARSRYRVRTVRVAKGLHLTRILDRRGPNRIRVLTVNPATRLTVDVALSNDAVPWTETTSSMARRRQAIAAINGTYGLPWGRPIGLFAEDGSLKTSPLMGSQAFSMSYDEDEAHFGHTNLLIRATVLDTGAKWRIDDWNEPGQPGPWKIAALTPSIAGYLKPPQRACSARLFPFHKPMWNKEGTGLVTDYVVDAARCSKYRMKQRGGTVLSAGMYGNVAAHIRALARKQMIRLRWAVDWRGVLDMIAGSPTLLKNSVITAPDDCGRFCYRHPRTGVGMTPDGRLLMVTVDGRRPGYSAGMTPVQFAKLFRHLGANRALNLDGGGSTTMIVKGEIVNRPSDSDGQRAVSSAVLILPGPDKGEPDPLPYSQSPSALGAIPQLEPLEPGPLPPPSLTTPDPSVTDPASTGGLLDALSSGALSGEPTELPSSLDRLVDRFRESR
jgi:uncharacterized protein YigE (DUF2233 family)